MKLDPEQLRAEADAHRARMESPLWARSDEEQETLWTAPLAGAAGSKRVPQPAAPVSSLTAESPGAVPHTLGATESERALRALPAVSEASLDAPAGEILPRLDALDRAVGELAAAVHRRPARPAGNKDVPDWIQTAAGDPHTYDAPDPERTGVCVRILPVTYQRLQMAQGRMGLRTMAGAWEFLLRLGLATLERLPAR